MRAFFKAVSFGAFAGAAPILVFTMILALGSLPEGLNGDGRLFPSFWLAILPLVVSVPIVLSASICIGIPLTLFLSRQGWESAEAYIGVGVAAGAIIPIAGLLVIKAPSGYWMAILGAVSGAVTAQTWWSSARKKLTAM